ncbi:uncharacterized protein BO97DRAFT_464555 [Aspergillus homomorphus CBS 101889]|uniref:RING-type domain-containing protein n=1 Tax=Aspergillus homomorphus (strain CBS 101889) TaxID=1450537 RepID=A0A395HH14_ASPHC|nr:hypothetical protein BO97DRAFT_464555 [Aspergillus homomorphus CBS 101889]RAL07191.1 hypothetical protein BO97DRAFT_464555 [Aspergillus homomorphus CBS 101889]
MSKCLLRLSEFPLHIAATSLSRVRNGSSELVINHLLIPSTVSLIHPNLQRYAHYAPSELAHREVQLQSLKENEREKCPLCEEFGNELHSQLRCGSCQQSFHQSCIGQMRWAADAMKVTLAYGCPNCGVPWATRFNPGQLLQPHPQPPRLHWRQDPSRPPGLHKYIRTSEGDYICQFRGPKEDQEPCGWMTTSHSSFYYHHRRMHEPGAYPCDLCSHAPFVTLHRLIHHRKRYHGH